MTGITINRLADKFFEELFQHHLSCGILGQSVALSKTDEETQKANPFEMAGEQFKADLFMYFHNQKGKVR